MSKLTSNEIKLIANPNKLSFIDKKASSTFIDQQKWRLFKLVKMSETASYDSSIASSLNSTDLNDLHKSDKKISRTPKIVATMYASRKPGYYYSNAFFLIFLITLTGLNIFAVKCKLPQNRLQITVTLLLTSVSFKWVINRSLPTLSYLTSLDKYAIVSIFYICLLCVWHSIVGAFWDEEYATFLDRWLLLAFALLFVLYHIGFLVWLFIAYGKIRQLKKYESAYIKLLKAQSSGDDETIKQLITRV